MQFLGLEKAVGCDIKKLLFKHNFSIMRNAIYLPETVFEKCHIRINLFPDSKVHGANMGPTWVLSAPDGPHVGLMNIAIGLFIEMHSSKYRQASNIRALYCWSLRCSWSIACRRCSNCIFILNLTPGFNRLGKYDYKMRREAFKFWDLVQLILETYGSVLEHECSFHADLLTSVYSASGFLFSG